MVLAMDAQCKASRINRGSNRACIPRVDRFHRSRVVRTHAAAAPPQTLHLSVGACCLPHPDKVSTGGEDAFFISWDQTALGVSDGVGGWAESGIDPGEYSRSLMRVACEFFDARSEEDKEVALHEAGSAAARAAHERICRDAIAAAHRATRKPGSATACVLSLSPCGHFVSAANLGDSGFALVRNGTVVYQSQPLQHFFDCPFQLGAAPEHVEDTDYPTDADLVSLNVMAGDVIVLATDGLWDNCNAAELAQLVPDDDVSVESAAEMIATGAREHAGDPDFDSPYAIAARKQGYDLPLWEKLLGIHFEEGRLRLGQLNGGKMDDITVVVGRVTDVPPPPRGESIVASGSPELGLASKTSDGTAAVLVASTVQAADSAGAELVKGNVHGVQSASADEQSSLSTAITEDAGSNASGSQRAGEAGREASLPSEAAPNGTAPEQTAEGTAWEVAAEGERTLSASRSEAAASSGLGSQGGELGHSVSGGSEDAQKGDASGARAGRSGGGASSGSDGGASSDGDSGFQGSFDGGAHDGFGGGDDGGE